MQNNTQYTQEDTIDLRELFSVLKKRKKLIWGVTALFTLLALAYAVLAKPVFEVKAVIELAQIDKKPVQDLIDLKQKLEIVFEVNAKKKGILLPIISEVSLPKETKNIMLLQAQGYDNASAQLKLQEVIDYALVSQDKELRSYLDSQNEKLTLAKEEIGRDGQLIKEIEERMTDYENKLLSISKQDAALAGIYAIEIGKKQTELNSVKDRIYNLQNSKNNLELSISPLKIQKATMVGNFDVQDHPIKPKKTLIVVVAFVTGLMLSIFLAFFLEFIGGSRKEEDSE
ncbi:Wzz/FepE/Etk N-terminal domain-containing protein [Sulfurovum sp.]|uniref:Wzz/FepE/Etk N-terminal domain-containing protein n=1 Tax=Sulfurovum sp. TaxID=1969726 RepID=UPI0028682594|nr:Wzz/FepE/Etk N-terminal domain-containing protein [Sulfurovum sp.]